MQFYNFYKIFRVPPINCIFPRNSTPRGSQAALDIIMLTTRLNLLVFRIFRIYILRIFIKINIPEKDFSMAKTTDIRPVSAEQIGRAHV